VPPLIGNKFQSKNTAVCMAIFIINAPLLSLVVTCAFGFAPR
jgi:hypothetical protein